MNQNTTVVFTAIAAGAFITVNHFKTVREERAKRAQIELNLQRDLAAIRRASEIVQEKVARGDYPISNGGIEMIYNDITFFILADHFQD